MKKQEFPEKLYKTEDMGETVAVNQNGLDNPEFEEFNPDWEEWIHSGNGVYFRETTVTHDSNHFWLVELSTAISLGENEFSLIDFESFETAQSDRWNNPQWINEMIENYKRS